MRRLQIVWVAVGMLWFGNLGCERKAEMPGPTVNAFTGKVVAGGKPVSFPAEVRVVVNLTHSSAQSFGIPIQADGSFKIGEMPIGKYTASLMIEPNPNVPAAKGKSNQPRRVNIPGGFEIKEGQTEYTIEVGADFKP